MAVLEMKKISIAAMKRDEAKILAFLQRQGAVEIAAGEAQSSIFNRTDLAGEISGLNKNSLRTEEALSILERYAPEKASLLSGLEGRKVKSAEDFELFAARSDDVLAAIDSINKSDEEIRRSKDIILKRKEMLEQLVPWANLEVPLGFSGTKNTSIFIGSLPKEYTAGDIEEIVRARGLEDFFIEVIYKSKEQTCIISGCLKANREKLEDALNSLQFSYPAVRAEKTPAEIMAGCKNEIAGLEEQIAVLEAKIVKEAENLEDIKLLYDYLAVKTEQCEASAKIHKSAYTFLLEGFILAKNSVKVKNVLEKRFDCEVVLKEVTEEDNAPTLMKNSWFSEPLESVVESYAYPARDDLDPTSIASIFYYIMFGLMFSDAGYGFILAAACGVLLLRYRNMESGISKFLRLFFWCGVSTVFWGIIFSSYFGDVVDVFSAHFLGRTISIPAVWFYPLKEPMRLLIFAFIIGIIHLVTGYVMNAVKAVKHKDYPAVIYDSLFPVAFMFSLLRILIGSKMFAGMAGYTIPAGAATTKICLVIAGVCSVGIILTGGRESRQWFKRILKGIFAFYNVIAGWISDVLSYSRLLALGLATGVICSVVNTLGVMPGSGIGGMAAFIIIFILGHTINFGINILGCYVHSNRLEYVEFFGKFYDGGGQKFNPLKINTAFYNIKEDVL